MGNAESAPAGTNTFAKVGYHVLLVCVKKRIRIKNNKNKYYYGAI